MDLFDQCFFCQLKLDFLRYEMGAARWAAEVARLVERQQYQRRSFENELPRVDGSFGVYTDKVAAWQSVIFRRVFASKVSLGRQLPSQEICRHL